MSREPIRGELDGRTALVVGVGPGIGRACVEALAGAGADVAIAARDAERLRSTAEELTAATGRRIEPIACDVSTVEGCRSLVGTAVERLGGIDIVTMVATAGSGADPLSDPNWDHWRRGFEVNVVGALEIARAASASMRSRGGGSVVYVSTLATRLMPEGMAAYSATKQAGVTAAKTMAKEYGRHGIRVNVVTPGYVAGERLDAMFERVGREEGRSADEVASEIASRTALRRLVTAEDIARTVLFLAGPASSGVTGAEIPVTGGMDPL